MVRLSQQDVRWGGKTIGKTKVLIKDQGCTLTDISIVSDYFGSFKDPGWMAKYLQYTPEARVYWNSINERNELNFNFEYRYYLKKHGQKMFDAIQEAVKNPNKAVILEIRYAHWVVDLSQWLWLGRYKTADPWPLPNGATKFYPKSYVTGCAVFKRR